MQIHDLNEKTLTNPAYVAFDDGTDTYKADFKAEIDNAAASAVADADLTDNTVAFTSGDAESPTTWTAVSVLTSGLTIKVLFNRISTMIKNVRYIWNLLGSSSFSNVASTLTGAIGNTALTTTAQTLSGAIAEHERDISTLNSKSKVQYIDVQPSTNQYVFQINSATGGVVNHNNFISMYVLDTNSVVALTYTYSNLIYVIIKNSETMTNATSARYKVRVWYKAE